MKLNSRILVLALILIAFTSSAITCSRASSSCKKNSKKSKKTRVGWQH